MATATHKGLNDALRGALIDQTDSTVAQQIRVVSSQADSGKRGNSTGDFNTVVRGALIDQADSTVAKQVRMI